MTGNFAFAISVCVALVSPRQRGPQGQRSCLEHFYNSYSLSTKSLYCSNSNVANPREDLSDCSRGGYVTALARVGERVNCLDLLERFVLLDKREAREEKSPFLACYVLPLGCGYGRQPPCDNEIKNITDMLKTTKRKDRKKHRSLMEWSCQTDQLF